MSNYEFLDGDGDEQEVGRCRCGQTHENPDTGRPIGAPLEPGKYGRVTIMYDDVCGGFLGCMVRGSRGEEVWYTSFATLPESYHPDLLGSGTRKAQLTRIRQKRHRVASNDPL